MFKGNLGDLLKQAQQLGQDLKARQEQLAQRTLEVSVGGGMVQMTFNGKGEALAVRIDPEVVDRSDVDMLQDLVLSAINEGVRQAQALQQSEMGKLAGGLNIPGVTS